MRKLLVLALALILAAFAQAEPVRVLFVGNSFTFGRADPVMSYGAAKVHDLTIGFAAANAAGTNPWEPHPWGGVPGIFKTMTEEAGLSYEVSSSTRNAAALRQHFLNAYGKDWDLRGNLASQDWDVVVLQDLSDVALPAGKARNANLVSFRAYVDRVERFIHEGKAQRFTEAELYGSEAACEAARLSADTCGTVHEIAANPHARRATQVYLTQTWARPDMVFAHRATKADTTAPDGAPMVEPGAAEAKTYYAQLAEMSADLHAGFHAAAAANAGIAGVLPAGDAFQRAVDQRLVRSDGFYDAQGVSTGAVADPKLPDLWWKDRYHPSKYGAYLDALVHFAVLTGRDPRSLGAHELAARELGIDSASVVMLERIAADVTGH